MTPLPPVKKLYTVREAAHALALSDRHVYLLIQRGELTATRIGSHAIRVTAAELDRYIADREEVLG